MNWIVLFHDDFHSEFCALPDALQDELLAHARLLAEFGPNLGLIRIADDRYENHLAGLSAKAKEPRSGKKTR